MIIKHRNCLLNILTFSHLRFLTVLFFASLPLFQPTVAQTTASQIIGTWLHVKGPVDFDSMEFAIEDDETIFGSWMNNRPATFGHWKMEGDTLTSDGIANEPFVWKVLSVSRRSLVLREKDEKTNSIFRKAPATKRKRRQ